MPASHMSSKTLPPEPLTPEQVNARYHYWRPRLMAAMVMGYAAFYLTRKSVNYAMPVMQLELGLDKGDIGLLGTLFYLAYGGSKFVSGIVSDRTQARWIMGIGLMMTGVLNVVFTLCHTLPALLIVWTLNGFFQGWGWPPCCQLAWY